MLALICKIMVPRSFVHHHVKTTLHVILCLCNLWINLRTITIFIYELRQISLFNLWRFRMLRNILSIKTLNANCLVTTLQTPTLNTNNILQINDQISDLINLAVSFGPAIISELDGTLLGLTRRDVMSKNIGRGEARRELASTWWEKPDTFRF